MGKLKFKMWKAKTRDRGYYSEFTDGRGVSTQSWWDNPMSSIDHVGRGYLFNRHSNVLNTQHESFVKKHYKLEMARLIAEVESK